MPSFACRGYPGESLGKIIDEVRIIDTRQKTQDRDLSRSIVISSWILNRKL